MEYVWIYETCWGPIGIGEKDGAIAHIFFGETVRPREPVELRTPLLDECAVQLREYFAGRRKEFTLPLAPQGTAFQRAVWQALAAIPYGETRTYQQIARQIGRPKAVRAVGRANASNPLSILLPCHRVVGRDGRLTGYAGGLEMKAALLQMEREQRDR